MDPKQQFRRRMEWLEAVAGDDRLGGGEVRTAVLIAVLYIHSRKQTAFPGIVRLAKGLRMSERHVIRCLKGLCQGGWLQLKRQGGGRGLANEYVLTQPEGGKVIPFQLKNRDKLVQNPDQLVRVSEPKP